MRGPDDVVDAARGYWQRRGLPTGAEQVVYAPAAGVLLLAVLAATGPRGVLLPRPGPPWHAEQARLLGRAVHLLPTPAECGGVPDPFVLLETVRRERAAGGDPGVLVLSVADDPTGTVPPPELLHEVCEAAAEAGLLVVSDESWRDTVHDPHGTVIVSPAEILHAPGAPDAEGVVLLTDLSPCLPPPDAASARPAPALARLPGTARGRELADAVRGVLTALRLPEPAAATAARSAAALAETADRGAERASVARAHGRHAAALCQAVTAAGGLCRPPQAGRHLYPDLEPLRGRLAERGVRDAATLEAALVPRLGSAVLGGHRFGDDPHALRVRLATTAPPHRAPGGPLPEPRAGAEALARVEAALADLTGSEG
ncbi:MULTISPECIES: aminotransferase class I/II-fold pyridoxal phosphate-dependent enzyme [Streptomyces]|uniref:aminotransferase class I/II-fold pyridoxal phosphate-dependent enzyme n=1 Tax=Streptomyces TaxID=1883 RepID=UPI002248E685|nr:aminotransferase class I/II-fold pyridoxal phosphate-dependent enzyme [Streptomyces sp. JHD 1]MCX2970624.1 aminotransferase class I/II-fold pyridoxal phosphate-dependent enzyme [Streptomyces sp. JHD 1]